MPSACHKLPHRRMRNPLLESENLLYFSLFKPHSSFAASSFYMEITDDLLRRVVRETLRELGPDADPALVRKVVQEVLRRLQQEQPSPRASRS